MIFRTDLAKETAEIHSDKKGISNKEMELFGVKGNFVEISDESLWESIGKKAGKYISFETDAVLTRDVQKYENLSKAIAHVLKELLNKNKGTVLVVGLGNESMTPDSIGPKVVKKTFVTRHIFEFLPEEKDPRMESVCAVAPGVLGVTGIESADIIKGIIKNTKISTVIVIDALAARRSERMFSTFQLTDTGIEPGAGVGNKRSSISKEFLGVPVIAIGVPTVVYASSLVYDAAVDMLSGITGQSEEKVEQAAKKLASFSAGELVVTPKEIDVISEDCAKIIADGINLALHNDLPLNEINAYMF